MNLKNSILIAFVLIAGCGYQFDGAGTNLPEGVSQVKVDLFVNRTTEPYLATLLTESITFRLMRQHNIALVEKSEDAEAVLSGEILQYNLSASAFDAQDAVQAYRATLKVKVNLKRLSDGKILWQGESIRFEDFVSSGATITAEEDLEAEIQQKVARRIAEDISWQLATGFGAD